MPRDGRAGMTRAWRDWWLKSTVQQKFYMGSATLCDHPCSLSCRALSDYHEGGECAGSDVPNCRQCAQNDRTRTSNCRKVVRRPIWMRCNGRGSCSIGLVPGCAHDLVRECSGPTGVKGSLYRPDATLAGGSWIHDGELIYRKRPWRNA